MHATDYSNPNNLNFYLTNGSETDTEMNVLKNTYISTPLGQLELAIIGSSHYLRLENYFWELLTCSDERIAPENLLISRRETDFKYTHHFDRFVYKIAVWGEKVLSEKEFLGKEQSIYSQANSITHFFAPNTSLTALSINRLGNEYKIHTWHTYPEKLTIIYSLTSLSLRRDKL